MTITPALTFKLTKGARTLDLNSGRYTVVDFAPPGTVLVPQMAGGTSANRTGGSARVGLSAANRQWTFTVHVVNCTSPAEVNHAIADLNSMLAMAGDESEPLFLFYKPAATLVVPPTWGQDGYYYEIAHADTPGVPLRNAYLHLKGLARAGVAVSCQIKPYAHGRPQRCAQALGGLIEMDWGSPDGSSKGLLLGDGQTNLMTNPVFGNGTFDSGWTAGSLIDTKNFDKAYILFGSASARLAATGSPGTFTQLLNVGNTNVRTLAAYVKRRDGAAVTSADVQIYYGSAKTSTYQPMGDGWYLVWASFAGIASNTASGVAVLADKEIFLAGVSFVENSLWPVPMIYGDMLGCSWGGTVHASASTRVAARARIPTSGVLTPSYGTIRVVVTPWINQGQTTGQDLYLFSCGSSSMRAYWDNASTRWRFVGSDNSNAANSASATFARDTPLVFHFVWGDDVLTIYLNGASIASDVSGHAPTALGTYLYIGSDDSAAHQIPGVFNDFTTWDVPMTAAQVAADYADIGPVAVDGQRVSAIPWEWTKDGDSTTDNVDDSTRDNYAVFGGVPGSAPAETEFYIELAAVSADTNFDTEGRTYWLSLFANDEFAYPSSLATFKDNLGTVTTSADLGSNVQTLASLNTSEVGPDTIAVSFTLGDQFYGRQVYVLARLSDAGANLLGRAYLTPSPGIYTDFRSLAASSTRRLFAFGPLSFPLKGQVFGGPNSFISLTAGIGLKRSTAGAANVLVDFTMLLFEPIVKVHGVLTTAFLSSATRSRLKGKQADIEEGTSYYTPADVTGQAIELLPQKMNTLFAIRGADGSFYNIAQTLVFSSVTVTPRWAVL